MNKPIVILCSESAGGKDTILNELVLRYGWHKAISYTTRPMRAGEVDGKDYHFLVSNKQFDSLMRTGHLFEKTEYHTNMGLWLYGLGNDSFVNDNVNITIVNPHGLDQLLESALKDRLVIFYVRADFKTRFFRYLNRDNIENHHKIELVDRIIRDEEDFKDFVKKYNKVGAWQISNNDNDDIDTICDFIETVVSVHGQD